MTINTAPQAYTDFQRWVDESVQNASTGRGLAPVQKNGIGLAGDWIPARLNFEAARLDRWVAVFLVCPVTDPADLRLAEALARTAMRSAA